MNASKGFSPPPVHFNIISGRGGLGDCLARLPAFRYMHDTFEHTSATIYIQDGFLELVEYLLPPTPRRSYRKLSEASWTLQKPIIEFDDQRLSTLALHLTDHAFLMLMDQLPPTQESRAYIKAPLVSMDVIGKDAHDLLYFKKKYPGIVVFTTDHTAPSREWLPFHINSLAVKVREAGFTPVLLGRSEPIPTGVPDDPIRPKAADGIKAELFVDLRDKTTLVEALGVIQRARAIVGLDNGLLHLAHCTDTPIVMAFSTLDPKHRVPVRFEGEVNSEWPWPGLVRGAQLTKVLEAKVPCKGCQSSGFAVNHDWRTCPRTDGRAYTCLLTLTADRFFQALKDLKVLS